MGKILKAKAPHRISFAGGGTDIEPYLSDYGSYVLAAAINLYSRAFYPYPSHGTAIESILTAIAGKGEVAIFSDIEIELGLGGSASCFVAGVKSIFPQLDKEQIVRLAFYLERKVMGVKGGIQDQVCASYGGCLFMVFEGEDINLETIQLNDPFNRFLVMINMGKRKHSGNEIIEDQLRCYDVKVLHRQKQLARLMKEALVKKDYVAFGHLLDESWQTKKKQSCLITTPEIDNMYDKLLSIGSIGGVLTGAGAGGCVLIMEHPEKEGELRYNLVKENILYRNVEIDTLGVSLL